jgi:hypothetical protein
VKTEFKSLPIPTPPQLGSDNQQRAYRRTKTTAFIGPQCPTPCTEKLALPPSDNSTSWTSKPASRARFLIETPAAPEPRYGDTETEIRLAF